MDEQTQNPNSTTLQTPSPTDQPTVGPTFDPAQIYPEATRTIDDTGVTAPRLNTAADGNGTVSLSKSHPPYGVIIIAIITLIPALLYFSFWALQVRTTPSGLASSIYSIPMFLNFLIVIAAIGLLKLSELARTFLIVVAVISILLSSLGIFRAVRLHHKLDPALQAIVNKSTPQLNFKVSSVTNPIYRKYYLENGLSILALGSAVVYLTRPKVKERFS
jgi:hypothetical protein